MCGTARSATQDGGGWGARKLLRRRGRLEGFKAHVRRAARDPGPPGARGVLGTRGGNGVRLAGSPEGSRAHVHTCGSSERGGQTAVEAVCAEAAGLRESWRGGNWGPRASV